MSKQVTELEQEVERRVHEAIHTQAEHDEALWVLKVKMDYALECLRLADIALKRNPNMHPKEWIIQYQLDTAIEKLTR
tara:strand:- start:6 stop:239 length:234 start_codon:yes stop_codon:yes gene_type:complete